MELRHLRYFVAAAELENVSRAAARLHVSQPALSRQIHDLEDELGFPLFERSAKTVHLTEAGRIFLVDARAILDRVDAAVNKARRIATGRHGELHIGYAPSPMARIMPATLRAFQADLPQVHIKLHDLSTEEMLSGIREAKLQLAFLVRPNPAMLRGLHFEQLARDTMCLAVPPTHRFAPLDSIALKQALQEPLVIFSRKDYPEYYEYLEDLLARVKLKPRIAEEHDSAASLIAAIESGSGLGILPWTFSCSSGPRLKFVLLSPKPPQIEIGVVWPGSGPSAIAERFFQAAKQAAARITNQQAQPALA